MKVELFIHGVPNGEGFWGQQEDRNYFATFYDRSADEVKFLVQNRLSQGKPYCYYNYLVYKTPGSPTPNIVANDGRDGSYFGISLRLDAYCKDVMNMFRILDTIYNIYVYGEFLKMEKSKLRYTFSDFSNVKTKLKAIETETIKLIQQGFYADSFTSLDGFATNSNKTFSHNLYEMSSEEVMQVMKQYGKIVLSPYYPTKREQQIQKKYESEIAAIKLQCEQEKSELGATLSPLKSQVSALQQEVAKRDKSIAHLQQEVRKGGKSHQPSSLKMVAMFVPMVNLMLLVIFFFMFWGLGKRVLSSVENIQIPMGVTVGDTTGNASLTNGSPQSVVSGEDGEMEQSDENVSPFRQEVNPTAE